MKSDISEERTIKKMIKIDGMDCVACCITLDGALEDLAGVKKAQTNFAKGECNVEFDSTKVALIDLVRIIQKNGFNASASE
jgi:copper chaperone CopZ